MKTKTLTKIVLAIMTVAIVGLGANAFAGWGMGYGHGQGGRMCGQGWNAGGGCRGYGGQGYHHRNLSPEVVQKMDQARSAFLEETAQLRSEINSRSLALRSELAKQAPDAEKSAQLQKELSELQARMDQKRLEHRIQMRKICPNAGAGYGGGCPMRGAGGSGW